MCRVSGLIGLGAVNEPAAFGAAAALKAAGYLNTGVELITGRPVQGVESRNTAFGVRNCWG